MIVYNHKSKSTLLSDIWFINQIWIWYTDDISSKSSSIGTGLRPHETKLLVGKYMNPGRHRSSSMDWLAVVNIVPSMGSTKSLATGTAGKSLLFLATLHLTAVFLFPQVFLASRILVNFEHLVIGHSIWFSKRFITLGA